MLGGDPANPGSSLECRYCNISNPVCISILSAQYLGSWEIWKHKNRSSVVVDFNVISVICQTCHVKPYNYQSLINSHTNNGHCLDYMAFQPHFTEALLCQALSWCLCGQYKSTERLWLSWSTLQCEKDTQVINKHKTGI